MVRLRLTVLILLLLSGIAHADGFYAPKLDSASEPASHAQDITEPTQKAAIAYYQHRERLVLQVTYKGSVSQFAWLVPTPSKPTVSKANPVIFHEMHTATAPRIRYWLNADRAIFDAQGFFGSRGVTPVNRSSVDVLERETIGFYDVSVLRARKSADLVGWLRANGYYVKPGAEPVLADYVRRGWVFTAVRINTPDQQRAASRLREGMLQSLQLDFATDRPVYPLKISSLNPGRTKILLYVLSDRRYDARPLRTTCALLPADENRISLTRCRSSLLNCEDWRPASNHMWVLTKLTADLASDQMPSDAFLTPSRLHRGIDPPGVPPPFFENLGALVTLLICLPLSFPFNVGICVTCIVIAATFGKRRSQLWLVLALASALAFLPISLLVIGLDSSVGYWPVGVITVASAALLLLRAIRGRSSRKRITTTC